MEGRVEAVEVTDDKLTGVRLEGWKVIPRQALAVQSVVRARVDFLADLGLRAVDQEFGDVYLGTAVQADASGATEVPGVWVAGNVGDLRSQVITSAAAGLTAGATINADLIAEETRLAVQTRIRPHRPDQVAAPSS